MLHTHAALSTVFTNPSAFPDTLSLQQQRNAPSSRSLAS